MKLQIAFDVLDLEKCLDIAKSVEIYADSFEIRSSLLLKHGVQVIEQFKLAFPNKELFVETQIVSHPHDIVPICIKAGADWVSVMAGTTQQIIHGASTLAGQKNKKVSLDLLDANSLGQAAMDATRLGVDAILYHNIYDGQDEASFAMEEWDDLKGNTNLPIYITSNIDRKNINFIITLKPDVIVIGKTITQTADPAQEAEFYFKTIHNKS
ncbi:orotidine 5'-phosphate decarboxylase [Candidatus Babeliales bacterium]|nr:orotidine 5'-phosphate decarboxylase [Candidatus Babeliales bacterium]MBP9843542.1 orotidine 5'-phosphate decarboxylase [Candidatus Babeliales bacterium]